MSTAGEAIVLSVKVVAEVVMEVNITVINIRFKLVIKLIYI